jgi:hypothetical protein
MCFHPVFGCEKAEVALSQSSVSALVHLMKDNAKYPIAVDDYEQQRYGDNEPDFKDDGPGQPSSRGNAIPIFTDIVRVLPILGRVIGG